MKILIACEESQAVCAARRWIRHRIDALGPLLRYILAIVDRLN